MSRAVDQVVVRFSLATSAPLNSHWDGRPEEYDQLRQCWLNERRLTFLVGQISAAGPEKRAATPRYHPCQGEPLRAFPRLISL
jgi:hypothetical protein